MAAVRSSSLITLALHDGPTVSNGPPFWRLLLVSVALHCVVVLLIGTFSLSGTKIQPLISQEVTLVSFPKERGQSRQRPKRKSMIKAKSARPANPPKLTPVPPAPPRNTTDTAPARSESLMREALASLPKTSPAQASPPRQSQARPEEQLRDAMSRITLPPETPRLTELGSLPTMKPTPTLPAIQPEQASTKQLREDVDSLLKNLKVPDTPETSPGATRRANVPARRQKKPSLSEDIKNTLRSIEQLQRAKAAPVEVPDRNAKKSDAKVPEALRDAKAVEKAPSSKKPATLIQAPDATPGSSDYLARVQNKISKHWMAPPVDLSGQSLVVVIKFRLHRSGLVSDVVVEQPSGNHYYDLAAERAIRSADPLPSFPSSLSEVYLDTHFTFTVGEQIG